MRVNFPLMGFKANAVFALLIVVMIWVIARMMHVYHLESIESENMNLFTPYYQEWTDAFNAGNVKGSCAFFSHKLNANVDGISRDYESQCQVFKKVFGENKKKFHYSFKLHDIYHDKRSRYASVRVTWYLDVTNENHSVSHGTEEGIDVLEKSPSGRWEIVNFIANSAWG